MGNYIEIIKERSLLADNSIVDLISPYSDDVERHTKLITEMYDECIKERKYIPRLSHMLEKVNKYNWGVLAEIAGHEYDNDCLNFDVVDEFSKASVARCDIKKDEYIAIRANNLWLENQYSWGLYNVSSYIVDLLIDIKYCVRLDTDAYNIAHWLKDATECVFLNDCQRVLFNEMHEDTLGPIIADLNYSYGTSVVSTVMYKRI